MVRLATKPDTSKLAAEPNAILAGLLSRKGSINYYYVFPRSDQLELPRRLVVYSALQSHGLHARNIRIEPNIVFIFIHFMHFEFRYFVEIIIKSINIIFFRPIKTNWLFIGNRRMRTRFCDDEINGVWKICFAKRPLLICLHLT